MHVNVGASPRAVCSRSRHHVRMGLDFKRLGDAIAKRYRELGMTQTQVAAACHVRTMTIRNLEDGRPFTKIPPTVWLLEPVLEWEEGSCVALLNGGDATPIVKPGSDEDGFLRDLKALNINEELKNELVKQYRRDRAIEDAARRERYWSIAKAAEG